MSDPSIIPAPQNRIHKVFYGPYGLRAGWHLLIFFAVFAAVAAASGPLEALVTRKIGSTFTAPGVIARESIFFADILLVTLIMGAFERRSFGDYGLPGRQMFRKDFWAGALWGFVMLSVIIALMAAARAYSTGGLALSGIAILKFGSSWAIGFLIVGFAEEFAFRGYLQFTLTNGLGFWPAAAVTCVLFALAHRANSGETWVGLVNLPAALLPGFQSHRKGLVKTQAVAACCQSTHCGSTRSGHHRSSQNHYRRQRCRLVPALRLPGTAMMKTL